MGKTAIALIQHHSTRHTHVVLAIVILILVVFFQFFTDIDYVPNYVQYSKANDELSKFEKDIDRVNNKYVELSPSYEDELKDRKAKQNKEDLDMQYVLPSEENLNELVKMFENYAISNNTKTDPFVLNNIVFGKATDSKYNTVLPIRMNLKTTRIKMINFLKFLENSGSFNSSLFFQGSPVRLMSVDKISMKIGGEKSTDLIALNLELNAYFQKSKGKQVNK